MVDGTQLATTRYGKGSPVICLHAIGHDSNDYREFACRLSERFEVIAVDWPGHGRSPPDRKPPNACRYAAFLPGLCSALDVQKPIVIGNSIGGTAAIAAAAANPELFGALVLCNSGGLSAIDAPANLAIKTMAAFFRAGARQAWWFGPVFSLYYRMFVLSGREAKARRELIVAAGNEIAPLLADGWAGFADPENDLRALVSGISIPVWLAWAQNDRFVSWRRSRAAAQGFPNHRVSLFPGSHCAFLESSEAFRTGFLNFSEDIERGVLHENSK